MRDRIAAAAKKAASAVGYEVHRRAFAHPARRVSAMRARGVDLVLDVGANRGQYVGWLRREGYTGRVVSFEPIPAAYDAMEKTYRTDRKWSGRRMAVGAEQGQVTLKVAEDDVLSSVLPSTGTLRAHIPTVRTRQELTVPVVPLDEVWAELVSPPATVMLKIDTQGFEHHVLDGVAQHLDQVSMVEVEMSLVPLYEGGSSIHDVLPRLKSAGFQVVSVDAGFVDASTGQVLDVDVLAARPLRQGDAAAIR